MPILTSTEATGVHRDELPPVTDGMRRRLLTDLLRGVSRAFYLTLRVLPEGLREPVGLAYLLARAADTIADTRLLPPAERLAHLLSFRKQIEGPASRANLEALARALTEQQALPKERELLQSLPEAFALLEALPEEDRRRVRNVVVTLTQGMESDLKTFPPEDAGGIVALETPEDLDRYTYFVAGCVGEFWTEMTVAHTPALRHWDVKRMSETGVRFGKALQYTNVLRDVPRDLRQGRCYLPREELTRVGLQPAELLDPAAAARARPVRAARMRQALSYFEAGEEYLLAIPRRCPRLRLAVLWPALIGLATLAKLTGHAAWLEPGRPVKVSRAWVYRTVLLSLPAVFSNTLLRAWLGGWKEEVIRSLQSLPDAPTSNRPS